MKREKTTLAATCLLAAGLLLASCASGGNQKSRQAAKAYDLSGTSWLVVYDDFLGEREEYRMEFEDGGRISNADAKDATADDDSWTQDSKHVIVSLNKGFTIYEGDMKNSRTMAGVAKNLNGRSWDWTAYRTVK